VKRALELLAAVFANPAKGGPLLDDLRARWPELAPDERAALTPLAQLAAERVKAAPQDDPEGYWAALEAEAPPEEEWSEPAAGYEPASRDESSARSRRDEPPAPASADESSARSRRDEPPASGNEPPSRPRQDDRAAAAFGDEPPSGPRDTPPARDDVPAWRRDLPAETAAGRAQEQLAFGAEPAAPPPGAPTSQGSPADPATPTRCSACSGSPPSAPASARPCRPHWTGATRSSSCRPAAGRASATSCPRSPPTRTSPSS
jgi:hypothetical protein